MIDLHSHVLRTSQFINLSAVKKKLPRTIDLVVIGISEEVFLHMNIVQKSVVAFYSNKSITNLTVPGAYRFNLCTLKGYARFKLVAYLVVSTDTTIADL